MENRLLLHKVALFRRMCFGHRHISPGFLRNTWDLRIEFAILIQSFSADDFVEFCEVLD